MRIGLLTTGFPRREGDVAGCFVLGFARALAGRGHSLEVLAPEPSEEIAPPAWPGIDVRYVPYVRPRSLARTFYGAGVPENVRDPLAWPGLATFPIALLAMAARRVKHWDAVVSHFGVPSGLVAGLVRGRKPHLAVLHSADVHLLGRLPAHTKLTRLLTSSADHVMCVSSAARDDVQRWLGPHAAGASERLHVQPMGISDLHPLPERSAARSALGLSRFTILTLARLVPIKGLCEALTALSTRQDIEWLIAGEGPERNRLEALAERASFPVRLLGEVSGDEKRKCLAAADAMLLPSRTLPSGRSEGTPTALLEAMSAGLPVIASRVGGIAETVEHAHTGLLFDPDHMQSLHQAIDLLIAEPDLARELATRARTVASAHEWHAIAPRLERLLGHPEGTRAS